MNYTIEDDKIIITAEDYPIFIGVMTCVSEALLGNDNTYFDGGHINKLSTALLQLKDILLAHAECDEVHVVVEGGGYARFWLLLSDQGVVCPTFTLPLNDLEFQLTIVAVMWPLIGEIVFGVIKRMGPAIVLDTKKYYRDAIQYNRVVNIQRALVIDSEMIDREDYLQ